MSKYIIVLPFTPCNPTRYFYVVRESERVKAITREYTLADPAATVHGKFNEWKLADDHLGKLDWEDVNE